MESDDDGFNWRNLNVFRNRKYEPLVDKLCSRKSAASKKPIFEYNKDLMVFAALVGYKFAKKEALGENPIQITLGTYSSDEKDGYIYLLALLHEKEVQILKQSNIRDAVGIFEDYCNGGLAIIQEWMDENPGDIDGVDTLVEKIFDQLLEVAAEGGTEQNRREVSF